MKYKSATYKNKSELRVDHLKVLKSYFEFPNMNDMKYKPWAGINLEGFGLWG